jgi:VWFA-related protein
MAAPRLWSVDRFRSAKKRRLCFMALSVILAAALVAPSRREALQAQNPKKSKHPLPLDRGIKWRRDPVTGELRAVTADAPSGGAGTPTDPHAMQSRTQMVSVTCIVTAADGSALPGLRKEDFRVFEDDQPQLIAYFDASAQPASVALVLDASPSVLPESEKIRSAADALIDSLAPLDQAAVIDFSAHTYLQLPFSDVREAVRRAVARVDVRELLGDTGGSNIYEAVYLTAQELFPGRTGRKAILLLTDGQDSGLGLTLDPASAAPQSGVRSDRLTFDDVARLLAAQDIQVFAVSTENRPKVMTPPWLREHTATTLISPSARTLGIPPYTLYLAELVRRAGGQIYFLRESQTVAGTFRQIAARIRAEYTLGFYSGDSAGGGAAAPGWHSLRVEVVDQPGADVSHRAAYYIPETP